MLSGRVPFDVVEAESELVSGALTELLGVAFSLALLAEAAELFLCMSLVLGLFSTGGLVSVVAIGAVTTAYVGRVLLVRYRVAEMATIAFVVLLWVVGGLLNHEEDRMAFLGTKVPKEVPKGP